MDGYLLVDKPVGWTSFDVVAKIRNLIKSEAGNKVKVGHAGTLDPFATGLLIILVGGYCKRAAEFSKLDKTYEVTAKLGEASTTGDPEGEITILGGQQRSAEVVNEVIKSFVGTISQTPPAYSAVKVNGQRAYKLARQGKAVEIEPRQVTIHSITDVKYDYPDLKFAVEVSSGTYIRSLVEDIGQKLGTGAYTTELSRTIIGDYFLNTAIPVEGISLEAIKQHLRQ